MFKRGIHACDSKQGSCHVVGARFLLTEKRINRRMNSFKAAKASQLMERERTCLGGACANSLAEGHRHCTVRKLTLKRRPQVNLAKLGELDDLGSAKRFADRRTADGAFSFPWRLRSPLEVRGSVEVTDSSNEDIRPATRPNKRSRFSTTNASARSHQASRLTPNRFKSAGSDQGYALVCLWQSVVPSTSFR